MLDQQISKYLESLQKFITFAILKLFQRGVAQPGRGATFGM